MRARAAVDSERKSPETGDDPAAGRESVIAFLRRSLRFWDVAALLGIAAVLALAPAAALVSARLTQVDDSHPAAPTAGEWRALTDLPAGLPRPANPPSVRAATDLIVDVFGPETGQQLNALLLSPKALEDISDPMVYPHRYVALEPILTRIPISRLTAPRVVALGATLIALHAQMDVLQASDPLPNAARIAFALLDRARTTGDCAAQLDVFLLVLADLNSAEADVRTEAASTIRDCPGDPTPEWLLGQYLSQEDEFSPDASLPEPATETFRQMTPTFADSPLPLVGQADAALRKGLRLLGTAPFAARELLESADLSYQAAARLGGADLVAFGRARTLIGLGQPEAAVDVLNHMSNAAERPPGRVDLLVAEAARDFPRAVEVGRALSVRAAAPLQTLFPLRLWAGEDDPDVPSPQGLMSVGSESAVGLTVTLSNLGGGAGGSLTNNGYVPRWRHDSELTGFDVSCPDWAWRRDAVITGQAELALQDLPETRDEAASRNGRTCYHGSYDSERESRNGLLFRTLLRLEAGRQVDVTPEVEARLVDARQNLWRWAGDLGMAEAINRAWVGRDPGNGLAWSRLGEVQYLRGESDAAAASLGTAARRLEATPKTAYTDITRAQLQRGAALLASGRREEGRSELRTLVDSVESYLRSQKRTNPSGYDSANAHYATTCYFARQLLADSEREQGQAAKASEDYDAALEWLPVMSSVGGDDSIAPFPSVIHNNLALAQISNRLPDRALASSEKALREDPANPVFLMTAGYAALLAGDVDKAMAYDRSAVAADPGAYPAANDLGVLLARQGDTDEAAAVLRSTVAAKPDYALGWFNLAVVTSRMRPTVLLESLGARGRAAALDPQLAAAKDEPIVDSRLYRTDLDLARPLPPKWTFASVQSGTPAVPLGLLATLIVVLNLVRTQGHRVGEWTERVLGTGSEIAAKVPLLRRFPNAVWAVLVTIVVLALPVLRSGQTGPEELVILVLGLAMLVTIAITSRIVAARTLGLSTSQRTWTVGTILGLGTGAFGLPWAPMPVIADASRAVSATGEPGGHPEDTDLSVPIRLALAAPLTLALVGALLLIEHAATSVRLSFELGLAAIIMAASLLLPVEPQDGARLGKTKVLASIGLVCVALLAFVGLL